MDNCEIVMAVRQKLPYRFGAVRSLVCDNDGYTLRLDLDEEWAAYETKTVIFVLPGGSGTISVLTENDICRVPVITTPGVLSIGVTAGAEMRTSRELEIPVKRSIRTLAGEEVPQVEPDVTQQIIGRIDAMEDVRGSRIWYEAGEVIARPIVDGERRIFTDVLLSLPYDMNLFGIMLGERTLPLAIYKNMEMEYHEEPNVYPEVISHRKIFDDLYLLSFSCVGDVDAFVAGEDGMLIAPSLIPKATVSNFGIIRGGSVDNIDTRYRQLLSLLDGEAYVERDIAVLTPDNAEDVLHFTYEGRNSHFAYIVPNDIEAFSQKGYMAPYFMIVTADYVDYGMREMRCMVFDSKGQMFHAGYDDYEWCVQRDAQFLSAVEAIAILSESDILTPAYYNGAFYTSPEGEIYTI